MAKYTDAINTAREFWTRIANQNGWAVGSISVWIDTDGNIIDHVAIRDGSSTFVLDAETEAILYKETR